MQGTHGEELLDDDETRAETPRRRRLLVSILLAIGCVALGVAAGVIWTERRISKAGVASTTGKTPDDAAGAKPRGAAPVDAMPGTGSRTGASATEPIEVVLSPEAVTKAGIQIAQVSAVETTVTVRVPGTVTANAYREGKVTPIAGGIVTRIHAELGTAVKRGMPLATLFSAELADVQTKYLSLVAMAEADEKKLQRTRELVEIGAASRQELEEVAAVHASRATEVAAARQRLLLLGMTTEQVQGLKSPSQMLSQVVVPAPIDGIVTGRAVNLGQVVGVGQELFVVTDLADVWVVGDLYEQDFSRVGVGARAAILTAAYPNLSVTGRVTYIDPRVDPQTRTAKVRVEVPNPDRRLRLGMFVTLAFTTSGGERAVVVPRAAVQTIGERHVVFVPAKDEEGKFLQRDVRVAGLVGDAYKIVSGIEPGELVVTEGSFFLRAESLRNSPSG